MSITLDTGTDELLCTIANGVATVTLNRPEKRNAFSNTLTPALRSLLPELETKQDVRCVLITGAGSAFCAGGDVSQMQGGALNSAEVSFEDQVHNLRVKQRTLSLRLYELNKPTIAALPGPAAGAGLSIALACDLRIAAASSFVTTAFANVGLSGDYGGSWFLTQLVGPSIAKELYYTARRVSAEEGHKLGLINALLPDENFQQHAHDYAAQIASGPPIAHRYMKSHLNQATSMPLASYLDMEAEHLLRCAATDDHQEAVAAFMEKRKPEFKGR